MKDSHAIRRRLTANDLGFALFLVLSLVLFRVPLARLTSLSLQDDRYTYVLLIPIISASLIYLQRKRIFTLPRYRTSVGLPLLAVGIALSCLVLARFLDLRQDDRLSLVMLAIVLVWMAGFALCYGSQSFRVALFPWMFLLLMIPIPTVALDSIVLALQKGSALMTYALFKLLGVPVLWQHFKFLLPGVEIEIAEECSGIRSSLSLFITSILAGYVFLQSDWRKVVFSLFTIPVVIFKNAVRIVTISCLGVYVDPGFLYGRLHRYGGLPFSLVSLAILAPLLIVLQRSERQPREWADVKTSSGVSEGHDSGSLAGCLVGSPSVPGIPSTLGSQPRS
jgi:exosortase